MEIPHHCVLPASRKTPRGVLACVGTMLVGMLRVYPFNYPFKQNLQIKGKWVMSIMKMSECLKHFHDLLIPLSRKDPGKKDSVNQPKQHLVNRVSAVWWWSQYPAPAQSKWLMSKVSAVVISAYSNTLPLNSPWRMAARSLLSSPQTSLNCCWYVLRHYLSSRHIHICISSSATRDILTAAGRPFWWIRRWWETCGGENTSKDILPFSPLLSLLQSNPSSHVQVHLRTHAHA